MIATVGINIVANFISPAFDFSNVAPQKISWRMGGMIAAVGSVLLTPWNWYSNPDAIFWTLGMLGALIGPLFGILIADFYLVRKQKVVVDDLFTLEEVGAYYYTRGYNPAAVIAVVVSGRAGDRLGARPQAGRRGHLAARLQLVPRLRARVRDLLRLARAEVAGRRRRGHRGRSRSHPSRPVPETAAEPDLMRIKVVNPNTTASMTALIGECARAASGPGVTVDAINPASGPVSIESHYDEVMAAPGVLAEVLAGEVEGYDGYVIACFGDPGLHAAREVATGPVVGIAEAAMRTAAYLGRSFSVVTTLQRTIGHTWDDRPRLRRRRPLSPASTPARSRSSSWRPTPRRTTTILAVCRQALAAGRLRGDRARLRRDGRPVRAALGELGVPVVDGVARPPSTVVEQLVRLGLRTSKHGELATPPVKEFAG